MVPGFDGYAGLSLAGSVIRFSLSLSFLALYLSRLLLLFLLVSRCVESNSCIRHAACQRKIYARHSFGISQMYYFIENFKVFFFNCCGKIEMSGPVGMECKEFRKCFIVAIIQIVRE